MYKGWARKTYYKYSHNQRDIYQAIIGEFGGNKWK
jgi:alkyl sulfatase BDS1-like metallo-beta-lactamase superfamily hydrolase